ncbi:hypothetical protein PIB30_039214 [Stylosanthes scabra]|uniref:Uncharacterized protein n=1 Tax=Stylosanthes scabra TaxID=79078 RepID=A0ABU6RED4_9FABA|nr:hypothetical protein [Stylosanthes scabra]
MSQKDLHGFEGTKDLSLVWCEHFPFTIVTDEHFQSKADLNLLGKTGKCSIARYMQKSMELEKKLKVASKQDKQELEGRVVELCGEKKQAEVSKKDHGFQMFAVAWVRAKAQAELFTPGVKFDQMDPLKVVYKGGLIDDDQVPAEGSDDHDPTE